MFVERPTRRAVCALPSASPACGRGKTGLILTVFVVTAVLSSSTIALAQNTKLRQEDGDTIRYMEADLYNLYPAIGEVNGLRSNYSMVMIS